MRSAVLLAIAIHLALTGAADAVGLEDELPPPTTPTTTECVEGQIYDDVSGTCVDAEKETLNDDQRYRAVRELAYAGAYDRARLVIASATQANNPRFLNYRGFIARKEGHMDEAMAYYIAALDQDPDYILARSYMGQGLVTSGKLSAARAQLREIEARGGRDTWAYEALRRALSGIDSDY